MLSVPMAYVREDDYSSVIGALKHADENKISCVNSPQLYPAIPKVIFKILHNDTHLFLQYFVEEDEILAEVTEDNDRVCTDSCIEFFVSFGAPYYYNLEVSCIGTAMMAYREMGEEKVYAPMEVLASIKRYPSQGREPFGKIRGDFKWDILLIIPVSAFWQSGLESFKGVKAEANFYKCGDNLTLPHYLSWQRIKSESPNFHLPAFFGEIHFE
ncbi:carbohydrate-binding family 9-like protein [Prevotella sp. 10(H)]|uniref:carbohydrate-binding family 9-like protein n=1 Tax=Prevotella sp. 10(H) TaxID=1158294 RepID=UPI0004A77E7C|nr:carbohydrate-binding family 9-like protein [Prevotella sp. 10(H)]